MGKYFLGSVGKAEAFRKKTDGTLEKAFISKTLTDSGLNISTTKDDIRAGEGAPIQFSFYHDPSVEITLTDVLWDRNYLTAQLGAQFDGTSVDYVTYSMSTGSTETSLTLSKTVEKMPIPCSDGDCYTVWYTEQGKDDWSVVSQTTAITSITGLESNKTYCIRHLAADSRAKVAEITSSIIPEELFLIITAPIYAGDSCSASKGKTAGHITFEVPRFQLNGAQEFAMNMSQNQTMSLSGIALAGVSEDCESNAGKLLRVIEVINDEDWYTNVVDIDIDDDTKVAGVKPEFYAIKKDGTVVKCDNANLMYRVGTSGAYTKMTASFVWPEGAGTYNVNIYKGNLTEGFLANDKTVVVTA